MKFGLRAAALAAVSFFAVQTASAQTLTMAVGAPVTVKGNRAEGLGAIGRGEGIACFAVAVVSAS